MSEPRFDFVQDSLRGRISSGISNMLIERKQKKDRQQLKNEFDKVIYFKTETLKTVYGPQEYLIFYTDNGVISPNLSPSQLDLVFKAKKGYIGFKQEMDKTRGRVNKFAVQPLDRAHSYPCDINLELLIGNNVAIPF